MASGQLYGTMHDKSQVPFFWPREFWTTNEMFYLMVAFRDMVGDLRHWETVGCRYAGIIVFH